MGDANNKLWGAGFRMDAVRGGVPVNPDFPNGSGYKCKLTYSGRNMTIPFYMGSAHVDGPTSANILSCLFSDSRSAESTFGEFVSEFGYETDTPADRAKAEKIYKACGQIHRKLHDLLADDYDKLEQLVEDW